MSTANRILHASGLYVLNVLISIDQLGNTVCGGDPDETISSRLGKIKRKHHGTIPKRKPVAWIIDAALDRLDPGHSIRSIESDEGKDSLYYLLKSRSDRIFRE